MDTNNDGHPHYAVGPGEIYGYQFTVNNRASTYWYHAHPHYLAGKQAYLGLAVFLIVENHDYDRALPHTLSRVEPLNTASGTQRVFTLDHAKGMWRIERASYRMTEIALNARGISGAESGWKDSALLWPGETLKVGIDFPHPFPGDQVFMLQCHNLEHESSGMMVNFLDLD